LHRDERVLERAVARITVALTTTADEDIPGIVAERRALREELHALREEQAGIVRLDHKRAQEPRGR
jgi:hypothetical protein